MHTSFHDPASKVWSLPFVRVPLAFLQLCADLFVALRALAAGKFDVFDKTFGGDTVGGSVLARAEAEALGVAAAALLGRAIAVGGRSGARSRR